LKGFAQLCSPIGGVPRPSHSNLGLGLRLSHLVHFAIVPCFDHFAFLPLGHTLGISVFVNVALFRMSHLNPIRAFSRELQETSFTGHNRVPNFCVSVDRLDYSCFRTCRSLSRVTFESGSRLSSIRYSASCARSSLLAICIRGLADKVSGSHVRVSSQPFCVLRLVSVTSDCCTGTCRDINANFIRESIF
jgi:hypothetical protein